MEKFAGIHYVCSGTHVVFDQNQVQEEGVG